ncbi:MAG TPA: hypothetical protein VJT67_08530 [Longimicrobiaceae bacterium]|nr:hypothetical protein [Longimicrobiaceae bacterium]
MGVLQTPGQDRPPTTRKRRLWTVAPGPPPSAQAYEGLEILNEIPTETGLTLFEWLRDVRLWTSVDPATAKDLFAVSYQPGRVTSWGATLQDSSLTAPGEIFAALVAEPDHVRSEQLAPACTAMADWATEWGHVATAAAFAEAAAWLLPDDPDLCFRAGRADRRNVAFHRAVLWFHRGIGLARRTANWTAYVDCWLGWGNLEISRGRLTAAERLLDRAYRAARKHNLRELGAAAQHDMFMLAVDQRKFAEAHVHASAAFSLYSPDHPSLPYLMHDVAQTWALEGYGKLALPILATSRQVLTSPSDQLHIAGNTAGAAGQAGDMDTFYEAWAVVDQLATRPVPYAAAALIAVAEGAFALGLNRQATDAATKAFRFAEQRQEITEEKRALELMESIRRADPPPSPAVPPPDVEALASLLLQRLREMTKPS